MSGFGQSGVIGYWEVQDEGVALPRRSRVSIEGALVSAVDDPANDRTVITVASPAAALSAFSLLGDTGKGTSKTRDSFLRGMSNTNTMTLTPGTELLACVRYAAGDIVTKLVYYTGTTAWTAGTGASLFFLLRDADGVLLARSADEAALTWSANASHKADLAFDAAGVAITQYVIPATGDYYHGLLVVAGTGTTPPTLRGYIPGGTSAQAASELGVTIAGSHRISAIGTAGRTTFAATETLATNSSRPFTQGQLA